MNRLLERLDWFVAKKKRAVGLVFYVNWTNDCPNTLVFPMAPAWARRLILISNMLLMVLSRDGRSVSVSPAWGRAALPPLQPLGTSSLGGGLEVVHGRSRARGSSGRLGAKQTGRAPGLLGLVWSKCLLLLAQGRLMANIRLETKLTSAV